MGFRSSLASKKSIASTKLESFRSLFPDDASENNSTINWVVITYVKLQIVFEYKNDAMIQNLLLIIRTNWI